MLSTGMTRVSRSMPGLVVDTGVEVDVLQQVIRERRLLHVLGDPAEASPMIGHGAAAVRDDEPQLRKLLEEVRRQALHERGRVRVQVMRTGRVETRVAARAHVDHRGDVVLDERFVDRIPVPIGQRRRRPVSARRIRVQVDGDEPVLLDAALQLRAGRSLGRRRATAAACRSRRSDCGKETRHAVNQLVADGGPRRARLESADVVRHEAGARREDRQVGAALAHQLQLVLLDALAQTRRRRCAAPRPSVVSAGFLSPSTWRFRQSSSDLGAVV